MKKSLAAALAFATAALLTAEDLAKLNEQGLAAHRKRNLGDASAAYAEILKAEPPAAPTPDQLALVLRFAPRLHNVAGEFFPLKDIVAILHPEKPLVAYHLFWEDDIGFPADNDPCDHEVMWVEFDRASLKVTRVSAYFHGRIITTNEATADANAHGGRPWIGVEWGFHGSLPWKSIDASVPDVDRILKGHWETAHITGIPAHPLARGWPRNFPGNHAAFLTFSVANDPLPLLRERAHIYVSRWATATLNRYCLRYNFAAKTEWPE